MIQRLFARRSAVPSIPPARWIALTAVAFAGILAGACGGGDEEGADLGASGRSTAADASAPPAPGEGPEQAAGEEGRVAQTGDTVSVHYRGTLDDGTEFDSSEGREPLTFTVGSGQVIPGFDNAVLGMTVGDSKQVRLEPADAYGEHLEERVLQVPRAEAPEGLEAGQQVTLGQGGAPATIVEVTEETVTVDANHPLAGQALTFDIELVAVQ